MTDEQIILLIKEFSKEYVFHLREMMDQRHDLTQAMIKQHDELTQLAIDKAVLTMDKRLEGLNEFRAQQADTIQKFATNEKLTATDRQQSIRFDGIEKEVDELKVWKSNMQGRTAILMMLWPIIVSVLMYFVNRMIPR